MHRFAESDRTKIAHFSNKNWLGLLRYLGASLALESFFTTFFIAYHVGPGCVFELVDDDRSRREVYHLPRPSRTARKNRNGFGSAVCSAVSGVKVTAFWQSADSALTGQHLRGLHKIRE